MVAAAAAGLITAASAAQAQSAAPQPTRPGLGPVVPA